MTEETTNQSEPPEELPEGALHESDEGAESPPEQPDAARAAARRRRKSGEKAGFKRGASKAGGNPVATKPIESIAVAIYGVLGAMAAAMLEIGRALGKLALTIWRLAEALDSALWRGVVFASRAFGSVLAASISFLAASTLDLVRWLPSPAGRAYTAGAAVAAAVFSLWILDELRGAARQMGDPELVVLPPEDPEDPIVARVDGRFVRLSDVRAAAEASGQVGPEETLSRAAAFNRGLVKSFVEQRLLARAATDSGLARERVIARKVAVAQERILAASFVKSRVDAATTPERVRRFYESQSDLVRLGDEVRARQIVVETQEEAEEILASLKAGGDFAVIAKARSLDRSTAPRGGEIGYFTRHMMTPVLANAAFTTAVDDFAPLFFTQYGWHIVEVLDRRPAPTVRFEAVEESIRDFLTQEVIDEIIAGLTAEDEILYFPPPPRGEDDRPGRLRPGTG